MQDDFGATGLEFLRARNSERLESLLQTCCSAAVFDIDGFIRSRGRTDQNILKRHAQLLKEGMILCPCTARGESLREAYLDPLRGILSDLGTKPENLPLLAITRNGALTESLSSGEILDHHPIDEDLSEAFLEHPVIQVIMELTPPDIVKPWRERDREWQQKLGMIPDPRGGKYAAFLDRHVGTGNQYKITLFFSPACLRAALEKPSGSTLHSRAAMLLDYCGGEVPEHGMRLAEIIQPILASDGITLAVSASFSEPHVDFNAEGVDKSVGYMTARDEIARMLGVAAGEIESAVVTGGDSPEGNDAPLRSCGTFVTNKDYFVENGPIVLDFPGLSDLVARTARFFALIRMRS